MTGREESEGGSETVYEEGLVNDVLYTLCRNIGLSAKPRRRSHPAMFTYTFLRKAPAMIGIRHTVRRRIETTMLLSHGCVESLSNIKSASTKASRPTASTKVHAISLSSPQPLHSRSS